MDGSSVTWNEALVDTFGRDPECIVGKEINAEKLPFTNLQTPPPWDGNVYVYTF